MLHYTIHSAVQLRRWTGKAGAVAGQLSKRAKQIGVGDSAV
ncbi:hypothetical protein CLOSTMETH_00899 [[Clostridium] methylpentosum DSM 5476]|uniref:Uncharacterized protein n=1 Tax=[Clostridium] methylpentosum DSM 5476 TaxID=537013 RepID=C0EAN6_9FIRM|nr:hypothetical protein CLOSTMETH_00899 [[Clostridium] methylpentosum DSM 5476]